ncbi:MAG: HAD family hydrolase [Gemella haemolysans]|jgi:HAD hydrolase, family IA, variant 1|uniref:HAD family hydrolase n=1 Tax=Gemella haemolysans TaxID=1379 RepID=UPI002906F82B|nr:HAD family hydrolase [Gemella haemolysans]MDU6574053.1 HAD family hydrolase [Gemella haemolysans]
MIGLVFDVDDTLYEQIVPFKNAYRSLFDIDIDMEKFYLLSRYYSDVKFEASRNGEMTMDEYHIYRIQEAARDLGVFLTDEQALNMQKEYKKNQQKLQMSDITINILELAKKNNVKLGVITNGPSEHQWAKIDALGVEKLIPRENIIVSGDLGIINKPDVRIFDAMQEKLQLDTESLYYIGDSFENDIVGANNAGWKSIWINRYNKECSPGTEIYEKVENNYELFEIIKKIIEK